MSRDYDDEYDNEDQAGATGDEYEEEPRAPASGGKISVPGAMMIAVGVVNLVVAGLGLMMAFTFQNMPKEEFRKAYEQQNPAQRKQLEDQGWTLDDLLNAYVKGGYGVAIAGLIGTLLPIAGGICMLARRARGLAIIGALVTAVPATSPCCLLGMPIGIWALVVLLQSDVKAAFR
jgi:hypothetical protein